MAVHATYQLALFLFIMLSFATSIPRRAKDGLYSEVPPKENHNTDIMPSAASESADEMTSQSHSSNQMEMKSTKSVISTRTKRSIKTFTTKKKCTMTLDEIISGSTSDFLKESEFQEYKQYVGQFPKKKFCTILQVEKRYRRWLKKRDKIKSHNDDTSKKFKLALNKFADRSATYMLNNKMGLGVLTGVPAEKMKKGLSGMFKFLQKEQEQQTQPLALINWLDKGFVSKVIHDQKECGACWAFAAGEMLASRTAIKLGITYAAISPQYLLDCVSSGSCSGGHFVSATIDRINNKKSFPTSIAYTGVKRTCDENVGTIQNGITDYSVYENVSPDRLYSILQNGPVAVGIDATPDEFVLYSSGILKFTKKNATPTHAITIVAMDRDANGVEFWLAKNSWGASWGEQGYVKLQKNDWDGAFIYANIIDPK